MPTIYLHQLTVEGPPKALETFRRDAAMWFLEPWTALYRPYLIEQSPGRLVYQYADDWKRPGQYLPWQPAIGALPSPTRSATSSAPWRAAPATATAPGQSR